MAHRLLYRQPEFESYPPPQRKWRGNNLPNTLPMHRERIKPLPRLPFTMESVGRRRLNAVDHENRDRAAFGLQLEPELFLHRSEDRRELRRGGR
jgi:hypothetical protein